VLRNTLYVDIIPVHKQVISPVLMKFLSTVDRKKPSLIAAAKSYFRTKIEKEIQSQNVACRVGVPGAPGTGT
jgi:hypothetical protein